jgi:hypothetical protein
VAPHRQSLLQGYVAPRIGRVEIDTARRAGFRDATRKPCAQEAALSETPLQPVTIVYWRDIPAQVIVGKGRRGAKVQLPERFEQAIDRCAMKVGAQDTDAYLAEWRKGDPYDVAGEQEQVAKAEAARLEQDYDTARIKALIANDGWDARG